MSRIRRKPGVAVAVIAGLLLAVAGMATGVAADKGAPKASWTHWGGPHEAFVADSTGLANAWPEDGPKQLWSRELGGGYSAVLVDSGRLYTMHRADGEEVVICLDAATGETIWEHGYDSSPAEGHVTQFGEGPRSTPLLADGRLYTIGVSGKMHALKAKNGKVVWSHDLWGELGGTVLEHGYSSSPIEYKDTIIVLVGGEGHSIVAFDKKDGTIAWQALDFTNSYSTPRILDVAGETQLVAFMAEEMIGVDPDNGDLEWRFAHENQWGQNITMPVMSGPNHLFLSSPQAGAFGLKLTRDGDSTEVEQIWSTRKIQFYHVTTVQDGDYVYGSTGTRSPAFMASINIKTGEIGWRKRGFAKANCIGADGRLIILDEDGNLALTTATPEDLEVHSRVELLDRVAWTVPTIVGKTMYVRNQTKLIALDLS